MKRNFLATLVFSQGVPHAARTATRSAARSSGNNNAYAQDNEISWVDWDLDHEDRELLEFTRRAFAVFRDNPVLRRRRFFTGRPVAAARRT